MLDLISYFKHLMKDRNRVNMEFKKQTEINNNVKLINIDLEVEVMFVLNYIRTYFLQKFNDLMNKRRQMNPGTI